MTFFRHVLPTHAFIPLVIAKPQFSDGVDHLRLDDEYSGKVVLLFICNLTSSSLGHCKRRMTASPRRTFLYFEPTVQQNRILPKSLIYEEMRTEYQKRDKGRDVDAKRTRCTGLIMALRVRTNSFGNSMSEITQSTAD